MKRKILLLDEIKKQQKQFIKEKNKDDFEQLATYIIIYHDLLKRRSRFSHVARLSLKLLKRCMPEELISFEK